MANVTYKVVKGDTLSEIAAKYNTTVAKLASINNIKNVDLIYVGQVLVISKSDGTSTPVVDTTNVSNKANIIHFGLQADTDRSVFAVWAWDRSNTENYEVEWYYYTANKIWFKGSDSTTEDRESIYSAPANAEKVRVRVKPISKKHTVNKKETSYWTAEWTSYETYSFDDNPPTAPSAPSVELKDFRLKAWLENLDVNGDFVQFQVVKNNSSVFATGKANIKTGYVSYSCDVDAGGEYKVRCRAGKANVYSDWSDYSANYSTKPSAPAKITSCKSTSETSVYLAWSEVSTAKAYDIEYTTKKEYFEGSNQITPVNNIETAHYELGGLETGHEYFFRVRAVNDQGASAWSSIKSVVIGTAPIAPTTWSSTTTGIIGDTVTLYWVHNTEDGSAQRHAQIELIINGVTSTQTINTVSEDDDEKTMHYAINTSGYTEGTKIRWRVRTAGVTDKYGEWSVQRVIDIYEKPRIVRSLVYGTGDELGVMTSYPIKITADSYPSSQKTIGYHVGISANEPYQTVDETGQSTYISAGQFVYSKYFDMSEKLSLTLSAGDVRLENNIGYSVTIVVAKDSGLTATVTDEFTTRWSDITYSPNAEISIDPETLTASVRPFCEDRYGELVEGVTLSVYRRDFDGGFTKLAEGLENIRGTFITDPHPSLDYARYRVVATDDATGTVSYYDIPGYPVSEPAIVIQWSEEWHNFDTSEEDEFVEPTWSGSMLKLPYNVDVTDDYSPDVTMIKYIGRSHPVGYYGTHQGHTSTWNTVIPASDKETIYALRRLAVWMGDVYVREPYGSGYWANVLVSFPQKHLETTIPVTLRVTRVEGGV